MIILLLVLGGGFYLWTKYYGAPAPATESQEGASINITLPAGSGEPDPETAPVQ